MKFPVSSRLNRSSCLKKVFRTPFSPIDESEGLFFLEPGLPITQTNYCLANYSASTLFYYDGDGNPVKSVVNGETILFVGGHYEVSNPGSGQVITKYYFAGSQRVAMRKYTIPQPMTVNYSLGDHLGSTSIVTDSSGAKLSETWYKAWGEVRYVTASQTVPIRYTYTGQYSDSYINLLWYGSRHYDPELGRFIQADSIVSLASQGTQAWDRYSYANNNAVRYTDPSGHKACDGEVDDCLGTGYKTHTSLPTKVWTGGEQGCTGTNWSVLCKDPTLVSSGQVQTPVVYPTNQTSDTYDGPYADEACVHPLLCGLLLATDVITGIQYHSNIPSRLGGSFVYANVNYEVHSDEGGNYNVVTGLEISNSTNAVLSLESIHVGDYARLRPTTPIEIKPNQTVIIPAKFMAGSSISLNLDSQIYNLIRLSAIFP